ncbi:DNA topoisomerase I [Purpureocillium lavendulum]|uniref:DNA topoisomerase I n=1 Tax=Purpureocillium lavendulum TaxID=1247861 RepID=A0AB34G3M4_9HYPO|nr:DNA topoisomerase I [Purpureocillium lavendulum]
MKDLDVGVLGGQHDDLVGDGLGVGEGRDVLADTGKGELDVLGVGTLQLGLALLANNDEIKGRLLGEHSTDPAAHAGVDATAEALVGGADDDERLLLLALGGDGLGGLEDLIGGLAVLARLGHAALGTGELGRGDDLHRVGDLLDVADGLEAALDLAEGRIPSRASVASGGSPACRYSISKNGSVLEFLRQLQPSCRRGAGSSSRGSSATKSNRARDEPPGQELTGRELRPQLGEPVGPRVTASWQRSPTPAAESRHPRAFAMAYDSSDDDMPLARPNGRLSSSTISRSEDKAMDRSLPNGKSSMVGLSLRNGPVEDMDVDAPSTNGANKRKSRSSISKVDYRDDSDSDGEPLAKRPKPTSRPAQSDSDDEPISKARNRQMPPSYDETALPESSGDDDLPLGQRLADKKAAIEKKAEAQAKAIRAKEAKAQKATPKKAVKDESDDDVPLSKSTSQKRRQSNGASAKRKSNGVKKEESDSDAPISRKAKAKTVTPAKKGKPTPPAKDAKKTTKPKDESDAEEEFAWWNAPKPEDDTVKWQTLEHNGVLFAPEYEPLPKHVKMLYDGKPVTLSRKAEEVAMFWVGMMTPASSHHLQNPVFRKNFFHDFLDLIKKQPATDSKGNKVEIKNLDDCDFSKIYDHWSAKVEANKTKNLSKEEKEEAKKKKDALEAPYITCLWDGRKQKVGNFRVEPPSLFRGRGEHPKTGRVKTRVMPEQITINIGKDAKVPEPPAGHKWKAVQHDQKATWLAMWQENINGAYKYVMLAASSDVKGQSDYKKFEKARELTKHIDKIRKDYTRDLKSEVMADRQRATAMYLIDKLALRAGNEKDTENEADTVGCCSLKYEHITLEPPNKVSFDFLGKDSIRYNESALVDPQVFKNLKLFKKAPKTDGDDLFDRLNTSQLNKHLNSCMPGLTAKVFRTYNASFTMSELLKGLHKDPRSKGSVAEKVKLYNDCNRKVAILCNHKRTVGAGHEQQMQKLGDRIKGLRYQKWRTKKMILDIDPTQKKKKGATWFELDEDLDEEWIREHQKFLVEELRTKITKKFEKENEKLKDNKEKPMPEKELKERLSAVKELEQKFKKENKTKKVEAEGRGPTVEKFVAAIDKLDDRIRTLELQAEDRDGNKEVALGTSKINYIDPRLTVVFAKKFDVPIEKFFSKTLREKFRWAIKSVEDTDDWEF